MENKDLREQINDFMLMGGNDLEQYLKENKDTLLKEDLYKTCLCLLAKDTLFYNCNCNLYYDLIDNIDNEKYIDDEENFI